ncbi:bifunctional folylpolyglutamate synthase/dihydrofolate synthase [Tellurirhabdus bombi]|uniref:bifunctional folylpolyglutamate synthase/dihydrofolate synthase n=1 Tax=Tellurirhabdus bombi TaxID=2907205 RepID=UPI001F1680E8|nr:folylpolyglutamate synthase/dihydrofolate synthase family protein [Tellurirhabdus bombi]
MTYSEAVAYLYAQLPVFHRVGAKAIKPGLGNIKKLCAALGNPQDKLKCIHVGGTNGKGSSSHLLSAVLQAAGYKTGLYTSPHLKSFTERIRVDGIPISENAVAHFVTQNKGLIEAIAPSFFEITVALAFDEFVRQEVDLAVIEVGLGGRLDSTNIITPLVSLITNIGWDHTDVLGDSLEKIAFEKAGIIKPGVPVVISERAAETEAVFREVATALGSPIAFASDEYVVAGISDGLEGRTLAVTHKGEAWGTLTIGLRGNYQMKNTAGVLRTLAVLENERAIPRKAIEEGFKKVVDRTGLKGRWQILEHAPLVVCDTAHNEAGLTDVFASLEQISYASLHVVVGFVKDKDLSRVIRLLPKNANYYFCAANIPRSLPVVELQALAQAQGLSGISYDSVNDAVAAAKVNAASGDCILITGSTYIVAELENL